MMERSVENLKKQKYFYKADIIVYILLAAIIIGLFFVFVIPDDVQQLEEIEIYYYEELIYSYDFTTQKSTVTDLYSSNITEYDLENKHYVVISINNGFNKVEIGENYAKMVEADCSHYAECVNNFGAIENGNDIIICLPHHIKVIGVGVVNGNEVRL
jgi:hypothetical protein